MGNSGRVQSFAQWPSMWMEGLFQEQRHVLPSYTRGEVSSEEGKVMLM